MERKMDMKLPNGFGSIVYLGKNRRRPYAIRKTMGWELKNGRATQVYKYVDYYESQTDALIALAKLNERKIDVKMVDYTFGSIYEEWYENKTKGKSKSTKDALKYSYTHLQQLHNMKIKDVSESLLQKILDDCDKGFSTKSSMRQIIQGIMGLAVSKGIRGDDPSTMLDAGKQKQSDSHIDFADEDFERMKTIKGAEHMVLLAYTGMRISELTSIEVANINLEKRYMVGGIKSDAGKNRIIPIHRSQVSFIKKQMQGKKK